MTKFHVFCVLVAIAIGATNGISVGDVMYDIEGTGVGEYKMAFRATAGIEVSVYTAFVDGSRPKVSKSSCCKQINATRKCVNHYRNDEILDRWQNIEKVAIVLYKEGVKVKQLIFNGDGSTYRNWFSQNRLMNQSLGWTDLHTSTAADFSLSGDPGRGRRFFLNKVPDNRCVFAKGWLLVSEKRVTSCDYEEGLSPFPRFIYAKGDRAIAWYDNQDRGIADVLAIYVKTYSSYQCLL